MNKKNLNYNININLDLGKKNSGEVPFITISNSKSNFSKNQNSKTLSYKYKSSLTNKNNSNFNGRNNRFNNLSFNKEEKSRENIIFTDSSLIKSNFDAFFNNQPNNYSSKGSKEDRKEIKTEIKKKNQDIKTPKKKKYDNRDKYFTNHKKIKKYDSHKVNILGKDLMNYFKYMNVNDAFEDKNTKGFSYNKNISNNTNKLNKKVINTNKSWNKYKNPFKIIKSYSKNNNKIQKNFSICFSELLKTQKKKTNISLKFSSIKNIRNHNNYFDNLLNKYIYSKNKRIKNGKKIDYINFKKNSINNNNFYLSGKNNINIEKNNFEKIKITPKICSYKRKLSCYSYLKIRENSIKNFFQNNKLKKENIHFDKKRPSLKVIKDKKQFNKNKVIEKKNINIKNINNHNRSNSNFFKFKDKNEIMKKNGRKNNHQINKGYIFMNRKIKK